MNNNNKEQDQNHEINECQVSSNKKKEPYKTYTFKQKKKAVELVSRTLIFNSLVKESWIKRCILKDRNFLEEHEALGREWT